MLAHTQSDRLNKQEEMRKKGKTQKNQSRVRCDFYLRPVGKQLVPKDIFMRFNRYKLISFKNNYVEREKREKSPIEIVYFYASMGADIDTFAAFHSKNTSESLNSKEKKKEYRLKLLKDAIERRPSVYFCTVDFA